MVIYLIGEQEVILIQRDLKLTKMLNYYPPECQLEDLSYNEFVINKIYINRIMIIK